MFWNDCLASEFTFFCDIVISSIYKKDPPLETLAGIMNFMADTIVKNNILVHIYVLRF